MTLRTGIAGSTKLPWIDLGDAPQFEIYYDMEKQWPAESIARRNAAMKT